jgi:hypothetical protein
MKVLGNLLLSLTVHIVELMHSLNISITYLIEIVEIDRVIGRGSHRPHPIVDVLLPLPVGLPKTGLEFLGVTLAHSKNLLGSRAH